VLRQERPGIAVELVGARGAQPQHVEHRLAVLARRGAIEGVEGRAQDIAVLLLPVHPCARVIDVLGGAAGQPGPPDVLILSREDGLHDQQRGQRRRRDHDTCAAQHLQNLRFAHLPLIVQLQRQGLESRPIVPLLLIPLRQRRLVAPPGARRVPACTAKEHRVRAQHHVLHHELHIPFALRVRWQQRWVHLPLLGPVDVEQRPFVDAWTCRALRAAFALTGMIGGHPFGGQHRRRALLPFEPVDLIAQALVLGTQDLILRRQRLDGVQQHADDPARLQVRDPAQIHLVQHPGPTPRCVYSVASVYPPPTF